MGNDMDWSPQQERALCAISRWLNDSTEQVFRLFGYAGTGKTKLVTHIAKDIPGDVFFAAYT